MQSSRRPQFELPTLPFGIAAPCQLHPALAAEDLPTVQLPAAVVDPELSIETQKFQAVPQPSPQVLPSSKERARKRQQRFLRRRNLGRPARRSALLGTLGTVLGCALLGTTVGCVVGWLAAHGFTVSVF